MKPIHVKSCPLDHGSFTIYPIPSLHLLLLHPCINYLLHNHFELIGIPYLLCPLDIAALAAHPSHDFLLKINQVFDLILNSSHRSRRCSNFIISGLNSYIEFIVHMQNHWKTLANSVPQARGVRPILNILLCALENRVSPKN